MFIRLSSTPQSSYFIFGQQPEGRIQQTHPKKGLSFDSEKTLEWRSLVAKLFFRKPRRRTALCFAAVYRSATNTRLKTKISVKARLISPRLSGEALRRVGQQAMRRQIPRGALHPALF